MTAVALETSEFASRRRTIQEDAINSLRPIVAAWMADQENPIFRDALREALTDLYVAVYMGDGGQRQARTAAYLSSISTVLRHTEPDSNVTEATTLLAVSAINAAGVQAAADDPSPVVMAWVTMRDTHVREMHEVADGQRRPPGSRFHVGGEYLRYPGDPRGRIDNTINCRCVLMPVPVAYAALTAAVKENEMPMETPLAWHGVLAPEGAWSGDGRKFELDSLRTRDLPLPLTWQKQTAEGHNTAVTVGRIDSIERVPSGDVNLMRFEGVFVDTPETDEIVGLISEFGRYGVSVDADDSEFAFDEETGKITFTSARACSACLVSIPAFAEAFVALGTWAEADGDLRPEFLDDEDDDSDECDPDSPDYEECIAAKRAESEAEAEADRVPGQRPDYQIVPASLGTQGDVVEMISEESWDGSAGRFTPEQWKKSCILHVCDGDEKSCHKLPIKEPGGALSRAGVHAAASRFGQVDAPAEAKASAARALRGAYRQLGEEVPDALKASGETEEFDRGPGWVTHPEDTRRIHAYWTQKGKPGYAKINWGVPGDFNRCRALVGEKIAENSPEDLRFLNQICAQWHHDAIGYWPGRAPSEQGSLRSLSDSTDRGPAISMVASAASIKAPAAWFENPNLDKPTHLTITEDGRVFGHIAEWSTCHIGYDGVCVAPPPSPSGYAYYATGSVLLDNGETARTGVISLGGGHAPGRMGLRPAAAHYDSTSAAVCDVAVGDDEHGIWCAGWVRPGTTEEQIIALRASDVSGDWRQRGDDMEMIAALAVNVAGFPVVSVQDRQQVALVAAGIVEKDDDPMDAVVRGVVAALDRRARMAKLKERVG